MTYEDLATTLQRITLHTEHGDRVPIDRLDALTVAEAIDEYVTARLFGESMPLKPDETPTFTGFGEVTTSTVPHWSLPIMDNGGHVFAVAQGRTREEASRRAKAIIKGVSHESLVVSHRSTAWRHQRGEQEHQEEFAGTGG